MHSPTAAVEVLQFAPSMFQSLVDHLLRGERISLRLSAVQLLVSLLPLHVDKPFEVVVTELVAHMHSDLGEVPQMVS